jgi:O-antigen/teichoic acid export membrane protein
LYEATKYRHFQDKTLPTGSSDRSKELKARIISGSVVLLSGSSFATAINLAYNVAVARFLGPIGFGRATAVYTLLTLASAATLSFQITSAKVIAQKGPQEDKDASYRELHRIAWGCGVLVAVLLTIFRQPVTNYLNLPTTALVSLIAVGVAFYVPLGSRRGYIQGAYGFSSLAKNLILEGLVRLFGSLLMILLGFGVTGVIAANSAAIAIAYLAIIPKLSARIPNPMKLAHTLREIAQGVIFYSGQVLINNCDIVLVKHFFASEEAGLYAAIAMVGRVTFAFSTAVTNSMFPVVASTGEAERKNLSLITTSLLLVLGVGVFFAACLLITPAWIWTRFFGASFQIAGPHGFPYLLALYAITTVIYSLSVVVITYEMSYKIANTSWMQLLFSGLVILGISRYHSSLREVILVQLVLMVVLFFLVAIPFLLDAMKNSRSGDVPPPKTLRLIRKVPEEEVIAGFIRSEFENSAYRRYHESLRDIVMQPDLSDSTENATRKALLLLRHRALWRELPSDTEWYEITMTEADLAKVRVFPRAHWIHIARGNFALPQVMKRMRTWQKTSEDPFVQKISSIRSGLASEKFATVSVLLIGVDENGPLTILDGNHRFVAAALEGRLDKLRFVCGLSPRMTRCCWYRTNLSNLTRYGSNLIRHAGRHPEAELKRLFQVSGQM